jgi:hypothetical protein
MYTSFPSESLNCSSVVWTIVGFGGEGVLVKLFKVNQTTDECRTTEEVFVMDCEQ